MQAGNARAALERELGGRRPAILERLDDHDAGELARAIAEAKRQKSAELSAGADTALKNVPRLLRGAAKRVLLG